jgi:hypothetical protein
VTDAGLRPVGATVEVAEVTVAKGGSATANAIVLDVLADGDAAGRFGCNLLVNYLVNYLVRRCGVSQLHKRLLEPPYPGGGSLESKLYGVFVL